jgi:CheY-like chemotaxis protein
MLVRLLLVEDHAVLAEATAEFLSRMGMEVRIAKSGGEALRAVGIFRPEIVLCDLGLPDVSGLDVARALHATAGIRDFLFVLHTALGDTELRSLERHVQGDEVHLCLSKPITEEKIGTLVHKLREMQERAQARERSAA